MRGYSVLRPLRTPVLRARRFGEVEQLLATLGAGRPHDPLLGMLNGDLRTARGDHVAALDDRRVDLDAPAGPAASTAEVMNTDLVQALLSLGYKQAQIDKVLAGLGELIEQDTSLEELVRERVVPGYFHGGCPAPPMFSVANRDGLRSLVCVSRITRITLCAAFTFGG